MALSERRTRLALLRTLLIHSLQGLFQTLYLSLVCLFLNLGILENLHDLLQLL